MQLKTVEERVQTRQYFSPEVKSLITQDRSDIRAVLLREIKGLEARAWFRKDVKTLQSYHQALDDILTLIDDTLLPGDVSK